MSNKKQTNYKSPRLWRRIGLIVLTCLLAVACAGAVLTAGGIFDKTPNPDNLLRMGKEGYEFADGHTGHGITLSYDDHGVISVKGTSTASGSGLLKTVTLEAGTSTLSGVKDPGYDTFGLKLEVLGGESYYAGIADKDTFTLEAETEASVYLYWGAEYEVSWANRTVRPVLVEGTEAGEFWAE